MSQIISLTLAFDTKQVASGQKIQLVRNKIFGFYKSEQMNCTIILADAGATIPVKESETDIKNILDLANTLDTI